MRIRDSGMPERATWEEFFDPPAVLHRLAFSPAAGEVADFGCGYGTFSIAAAQLTPHPVHAFDIDPHMVAATSLLARRLGLANVRAIERDFAAHGTGLPAGSIAYAMLFNILHAEDATGLLSEAFRVLRPDGVLAIIHWVHDSGTPRGPPLGIRPRAEQCAAWAQDVGFLAGESAIALPPYHYGVLARRPA
jgi:SAM-dependent methyltransferase